MTRERLLAMLKEIEASVGTKDPRGAFTRDLDECPYCGGVLFDHSADCELFAAISWLETLGEPDVLYRVGRPHTTGPCYDTEGEGWLLPLGSRGQVGKRE